MSTAGPPLQALARIDAHYRKFLNSRWIRLVVLAGISTDVSFFLVPALLISWYSSVLSALATLFLLGPIVYLLSTHLVLLARRRWVISPPALPAGTTARSVLLGSFSPSCLAIFASHWVFAVVFTLAFALSLNMRSPSLALGLLSPTPRHHWHGNERLWFIMLGMTSFSLLIAARDILRSNLYPVWPKKKMRFPQAVRRSLQACFGSNSSATVAGDAAFAVSFTVLYSFAYFVLRHWAWRKAAILFPFLRPFIINFAKSSRNNATWSWSLPWYLFVLQITALLALKPASAVLNDYLTQPLDFASFTSRSPLSPDRYLITALDSKNAFYVDHTVIELQRIAHSQARRAVIFADTSKPPLTHDLYRALLVQLGKSYSQMVNRGYSPKPKGGPPVSSQPDPHSVAIKTADIFRPSPPKSGLQKIVGTVLEGTPQPTPAPVIAIAERARQAEASVIKRVEAPVHALETWASGIPVLDPIVSAGKLVCGGYTKWAGAAWARRSVFAAVPEQDRLSRLVDILATLTVASADEDTYGYVQAVLPSTLEAFIRLRRAAHALNAEIAPLGRNVSPEADADLSSDIAEIVNVLDEGVRRIADRFGKTLSAFRFPGDIALELTEVCRA